MPISKPVRIFLTIAVYAVFLVALPLLFLSDQTDAISPDIKRRLPRRFSARVTARRRSRCGWRCASEWERIRTGVWVITTGCC